MTDINHGIDDCLDRLACVLAVCGSELGKDAHEAVAALVDALDASQAPGLDEVLALAHALQDCADAEQANARLETLGQAWDRWKRGEPAPATPDASPATAPPAAQAPSETATAEAAGCAFDSDVASLAADPEMAAMFTAEALDHLGTIEATLLQLESNPEDVKLLNDVFRPFHTVKGNAGALGVTTVQELAHTVESLLDRARSGKHRMGPTEFDVVLKAVDLLTAYMHELNARIAGGGGIDLDPRRRELMRTVEAIIERGSDPASGAQAPAQPTPADTAAGAGPAQAAGGADADASPAQADVGGGGIAWRRDDLTSVKVDTRKLDNLVDMVGELVIQQSIIEQDPALKGTVDERLARNLAQLRRITTDLQRTAMAMRMVPIRQTFQKMARLVRDLTRKSGKPVELLLSGEETELDRRVVEDINDPLMHMIRNSIDHGIEPPDVRLKAGKRAQGTLSLSAFHQGGNIVIAIADDGAGLNTDRIRAKAISQGLIAADAQLSPAEIHQLIFQPGFSTAEKVTEISGRGVGMDVVRRNIDALRGRIEIQSEPGQGTTFSIKLPLTLAIVEGLVVGVGGQRFVLPTFSVRESLRPSPEQVHTVQERPVMIQVRGRLIPLMRLADLAGIQDARQNPCEAIVLVIEEDGRQLGLVVDHLLGKQEVVIKSLGEMFSGVRGVAGGAILGDGRIGLILDAHGIIGGRDSESERAA